MWVKLDDRFAEHLKTEGISDAAFRLHVTAMCYCGGNLTDGRIPAGRVQKMTPHVAEPLVAELVAAGLWDVIDEGYAVHDFLEYNLSKAQVLAMRDAAAERKRKWREKKEAERNGVTDAGTDGGTDGGTSASPTRPDPSRPEGSRDGSGAEPSALGSAPSPSDGAEQAECTNVDCRNGWDAAYERWCNCRRSLKVVS